MEEKKNEFIAYLDDDGKKKEVWCNIVEQTSSYVTFTYQGETITVPFHRVLKIKKIGGKEYGR